jgi:hypothetical protein
MTVPLEPSTELSQEPAGSRETVISCLVRIGAQLGIDIKIEAVCRGTAGVIVLFDMRGRDGVFYELLDDDQNVVYALSYADFLAAYKAQEDA